MPDSPRPLQDTVDRYVRGELTPVEARALARESLGDAELFEQLTFAAVAKTTLAKSAVRGQLEEPVGRTGRTRLLIAAAAAAVVVVSVYSLRQTLWRPAPPSAQRQPGETAPASRLRPTLTGEPGQPVLLALGMPARPEDAPVFRGSEPGSRDPRPSGSIVSIEDGTAAIDLGSLDGVAKGTELGVFADDRATQPIGRLIATAVFRERARARIEGGRPIAVNTRVRVPDTAHLQALLDRVDARSRDVAAAGAAAEKAAAWAETADVPAAERGRALERLAAVEQQAGSLSPAEGHYGAAVESYGAAAPASALNNLAVLRLLRGDYAGAEAPLARAAAKDARSLNNLGVLAELRGDRQKAESLYADALRAPGSSEQERRTIESNLARLSRR